VILFSPIFDRWLWKEGSSSERRQECPRHLRQNRAPWQDFCRVALLHFVELGEKGGAGAGDGAVVVNGEDAGIGDDQAEAAAGDVFLAFDGVRTGDGVAAEGDVSLPALEFGVDGA
jgi:hypothetical protein